MTGVGFLKWTAALYTACFLLCIISLKRKNGPIRRLAVTTLVVALALNVTIIVAMWIEAGRAPFKTRYETLVLFCSCISAYSLGLFGFRRLFVVVPFSSGMTAATLWLTSMQRPWSAVQLPPALQSPWFVPHVSSCFVAYAALFVSFSLALTALVRRRNDPDGEAFRNLAREADSSALLGTFILTFGLISGALWAQAAWSNYWGWDPKENWGLATWITYVIYLHMRRIGKWKGRRAMWVLVIAFGVVMFTYLGMRLLPSASTSIHVYQ